MVTASLANVSTFAGASSLLEEHETTESNASNEGTTAVRIERNLGRAASFAQHDVEIIPTECLVVPPCDDARVAATRTSPPSRSAKATGRRKSSAPCSDAC